MTYLYHIKPKEFTGDYLLPLSSLSEQRQKKEMKKYVGRCNVPEQSIPSLNCKWSDIIHLSPVNPIEIKKVIQTISGREYKFKFYKIPVDVLKLERLVIYLNTKTIHNTSKEKAIKNEYIPFSIDEVKKYTKLPDKTIEYYNESLASGVNPLLFYKVPHVFYKGDIDVSSLEVLE